MTNSTDAEIAHQYRLQQARELIDQLGRAADPDTKEEKAVRFSGYKLAYLGFDVSSFTDADALDAYCDKLLAALELITKDVSFARLPELDWGDTPIGRAVYGIQEAIERL